MGAVGCGREGPVLREHLFVKSWIEVVWSVCVTYSSQAQSSGCFSISQGRAKLTGVSLGNLDAFIPVSMVSYCLDVHQPVGGQSGQGTDHILCQKFFANVPGFRANCTLLPTVSLSSPET